MCVWVITEDDLVARFLSDALIAARIRPCVVRTIQEMLAVHREDRPRAIFLDFDVSAFSAKGVIKHLNIFCPQVAVVCIVPQDCSKWPDVKAFDYIVKPLVMDEVNRVVNWLMRMDSEKNSLEFYSKKLSDKMLVQANQANRTVKVIKHQDIIMVTREGRKTIIYTVHGVYSTNQTLTEVKKIWVKNSFDAIRAIYLMLIWLPN